MSPQELEEMMAEAKVYALNGYEETCIERFVGPTLCKLAPSLLDLWRAADTLQHKVTNNMQHIIAVDAIDAALARLREVRL